jgi:predicted Zn-ribbon and HTH transcriptional regulator
MEATTRERIADHLREAPATPSALATEFDVTASAAVRHVRHLARSLDAADEQLQVAPPTCEDCGFDRFDEPANRPSRCPDCKSEAVTDPVFRIE